MEQWETASRVGGAPAGDVGGYPAAIWAALGAPETRYAKSDDGYVAYQVFGGGPFALLFIGNWASNIEVMWEHPLMARYLDRLSRFARVICFDKRGAGLSDPVALGALPTLEHWIDDARIVLDAVGSTEAALIGECRRWPDGHDVRCHLPATHSGVGAGQYVRKDAAGSRLPDRDARRGGGAATTDLGGFLGYRSGARTLGSQPGRRPADAALGWPLYAPLGSAWGVHPHVSMGASGGRAVGAADYPGSNAGCASG
jgi:hypothetical protein